MQKWCNSKILLGCAFFHDLLKPSAYLCKMLQADDVCVVSAMEAIGKASKLMENVKASAFKDLPSVKVLSRITHSDNGTDAYQGIELTKYKEGLALLQTHYQEYTELVIQCVSDGVNVQTADLLNHSLTILVTNGWERTETPSFGYSAIDFVCKMFVAPLENAAVNSSLVQGEWDDMLEYAKSYLNLTGEDYRVIWWKLFNGPDLTRWSNILSVTELLFCIPVSNGHLERVFSQLKLIKSDRRSRLGDDNLDNLLRIKVDAPPLLQWDSTGAVNLWWKDKTCRISTTQRFYHQMDLRLHHRPYPPHKILPLLVYLKTLTGSRGSIPLTEFSTAN